MIINNVEIQNIDVTDADTMERYETALDAVSEKMDNFDKKGKRRSEIIRYQCAAVFDFFDTVFGDGTAKVIFGESTNLKQCLNAFKEVIEKISAYSTNADKQLMDTAKSLGRSKQKNNNKKQYNHYKKPLKIHPKSNS